MSVSCSGSSTKQTDADEMYQAGPNQAPAEKQSVKKKKWLTPRKKTAVMSPETPVTVTLAEAPITVTSSEAQMTVTSPEVCDTGPSSALPAEAATPPPMEVEGAREDGFVVPKSKKGKATTSVKEIAPVPQRNRHRRTGRHLALPRQSLRRAGTTAVRGEIRIQPKTEDNHRRLISELDASKLQVSASRRKAG